VNELSVETEIWLKFLGDFGPTTNAKNCEMKGYMLGEDGEGGKVYLNNEDFRSMSHAANEVADWLEARAAQCSE